jgi:hypothetical protein
LSDGELIAEFLGFDSAAKTIVPHCYIGETQHFSDLARGIIFIHTFNYALGDKHMLTPKVGLSHVSKDAESSVVEYNHPTCGNFFG